MVGHVAQARTILVVDDDEDVLASIRDVLRYAIADANVETARSAREALRQLRRRKADAIVTDYRMPGMDGLQLTQAVRRDSPSTPVIMVTAFRDRDVEDAAEGLGIGRVVHKPFDIAELVDAVRAGLDSPRRT